MKLVCDLKDIELVNPKNEDHIITIHLEDLNFNFSKLHWRNDKKLFKGKDSPLTDKEEVEALSKVAEQLSDLSNWHIEIDRPPEIIPVKNRIPHTLPPPPVTPNSGKTIA